VASQKVGLEFGTNFHNLQDLIYNKITEKERRERKNKKGTKAGKPRRTDRQNRARKTKSIIQI
jgi:uncharacterized metal-binding protein